MGARDSDTTGTAIAHGAARGPARAHDQLFTRILRTLRSAGGYASAPSAEALVARCHALLSERGEVSGRRGALEAIAAYRALADPERRVFFERLVSDFSPNREGLERAIDAYRRNPSHAAVLAVQGAAEAPRQELFRRFNLAPGGTQALIDMRRDLLGAIERHPDLRPVDTDLAHLFRSWFNRGFLTLQRIDWRTSALVLERLIQYEAVHQITSWRDLRRRLEADRRCYAFFHPSLPDEPLIFIEVALTRGMSATVHHLIDPEAPIVDPERTTAAMFYSITSCQEGLRGISFGNFLIKQVVEDLGSEFRRLTTFATLSPIPGFRAWLDAGNAGGDRRPMASAALKAFLSSTPAVTAAALGGLPRPLQRELSGLCAWYLTRAKRDRAPLDAVARFHLANGARLERLNWLGDVSDAGLRRSLGLTVNYVYRLADLERNHEQYARDASVITSRTFARLIPPTQPRR